MRLLQPNRGKQSLKLAEDEAYLIAVQRWFSVPLLGDRQAWAGREAGYIPGASVGGTPVLSVPKPRQRGGCGFGQAGKQILSSQQLFGAGGSANPSSEWRQLLLSVPARGQFRSKGLGDRTESGDLRKRSHWSAISW